MRVPLHPPHPGSALGIQIAIQLASSPLYKRLQIAHTRIAKRTNAYSIFVRGRSTGPRLAAAVPHSRYFLFLVTCTFLTVKIFLTENYYVFPVRRQLTTDGRKPKCGLTRLAKLRGPQGLTPHFKGFQRRSLGARGPGGVAKPFLAMRWKRNTKICCIKNHSFNLFIELTVRKR
jgi:hypothetical protein